MFQKYLGKEMKLIAPNAFSLILLSLFWVYAIMVLKKLPDNIPLQINLEGETTRSGPKFLFIIFPFTFTLFWIRCRAIDNMGFRLIRTSVSKIYFRVLTQSIVILTGTAIIWLCYDM